MNFSRVRWLFVIWMSSFLAANNAAAAEENAKAADKPASGTANSAAPLPAVLVAIADNRPLGRQTEFIGRVEALEKVDLRARVTGFLRERKFEAGAQVNKGDVLFLIESEPFEAALAQRRAQLASAEATLDNANVALQRYETLESKQVASTAQLDVRVAEQKRAAASVQEAKAAIQDAEIKLSYATIAAPISGQIGRSAVDPGNLVGPETGVLATLVRTDKVYVVFPVTQAQLLQARKNGSDAAKLTVRAKLADDTLLKEPGEIDFVDVKVDPRTDGQLVRAVFPNAGGTLTDGQTVRLIIERRDPDKFVTIPVAAVITDQTGPYVFVVDGEGVVQQRRVKLGVSRDSLVAVNEGIKEGEQVIVQGLQKVRPGVKVAAQPSESTLNNANPDAKK